MPVPKPIDRGAVASLVRGILALAPALSLDRTTDPRRVLPVIPPVTLWRVLPRLLAGAADLAADLDVGEDTTRAFARNVASTIEGKAVAS